MQLTRKSKRLIVFSEIEKRFYYEVPNFDDSDREQHFDFSKDEEALIRKSKITHYNIFCALQIGYFKAAKIFPQKGWKNIKIKDINYLKWKYFPNYKFDTYKHTITEYECYTQRINIAKLYGYKLWEARLTKNLTEETAKIIRRDTSPNFIGHELIKFLEKIKLVRPGYTTLQSIIGNSLTLERKRIALIINKELKTDERKAIDSLTEVSDGISALAELYQDAKNFGFKMMSKERQKHRTLEELYIISLEIINKLDISQHNIKHYADLARYYNSRDLSRLKYNQGYLYILCYIFTKYRAVNDNLVEAFRYNIKKIDNGIRAKVKEQFQEEKANVENKVGRLLLLYVNEKIDDQTIFKRVRKRAFRIMERSQIENLGNKFLKKGQHKKEFFWREVDRSQKVYQKNLRPLFNRLKFSSEKADNKWLKSINWLKNNFNEKDVKLELQPDSLRKNLKKYLLSEDKSLNIPRYEYWLYNQIEEKIKSGKLYLKDSLLYNCFNHELISIKRSKEVLKGIIIPWIKEPASKQVYSLLNRLDNLWITINEKYKQGELKHLRYNEQKKKFIWSKIRAQKNEKLENKFYSQLPFCEINQVMRFVNERTNFLSAFKPLQDRCHKEETISDDRKRAAILSKALNYGDYKMAQVSDISYQELKRTSSQILRLSTLREANDIICDAITELPIYQYYSIDLELLFSSLDGQKYELETANIKARKSKKYLREKPGVSAYTILANNIPFNSYVIGSNEHESYYVFDIWYNNTTNIDARVITGDMHSINKGNFAILHCFGAQYKPRFTSLNTELKRIYSGNDIKAYCQYLAPAGQINSDIIIENEEKINQILGTLGLKEMNQANLIKKLCNLPPENSLRKAIFELDKLIRSIYTLEYMMDQQLQRNVHKSQNRIEAYHNLRAAIAKIGGRKKLYGKTDTDIEVSNQCGRLTANLAIYYNSLILSGLIKKNPKLLNNKKFLNMLRKISPIAWQHIHFLGQYTFKTTEEPLNIDEILNSIKLKF